MGVKAQWSGSRCLTATVKGPTIMTRPDWNQTDPAKSDFILNKPEVITSTPQDLTEAQQAQARQNIQAASEETIGDIGTAIDKIIDLQESLIGGNTGGGSVPPANAVLYVEQSLSEEQQSQARINIGIIGTGADGKDGVGISGATVSVNGDLSVTLTDNTVLNLGNIKGPQGDTGAQGPQGEKGETGPTGADGKDGSDASVTTESITSALGYAPADAAVLADEVNILESLTEIAEVVSGSINLNDGIYEYGRFATAGTEYDKDSPIEGAFRSANYLPVKGGRSVVAYYNAGNWNGNSINRSIEIVQYDADKNLLESRQSLENYIGYAGSGYSLMLNENTAYIRISFNRNGTAIDDLTEVQIGIYYQEDAVKEYVPYETVAKVYMIRQDRVKGYEPLEGKTIVYDGDSICESRTSGTGNNGGGYAKIIADITRSMAVNQAVGGARLCAHDERHSVVNNLSNLPTTGDLYCFEGGINDFWGNTAIGTNTPNDFTSAVDATTICGAMETIFRYALENFAGKPICFVITHKIKGTAYSENANGDTFKDYRDAMVEICEKYSIPYYDAFSESGLNGWNTIQNSLFLTAGDGTADGTHPNADGYKRYYVPQLLNLFRRIMPVD